MSLRVFAVAANLVFASFPALAADGMALPKGQKTISIVSADGTRQNIGSVTFVPAGESTTFEIEVDAPEFSDEFLSMRPFRCMSGAKEMWCYLQYPYELKRTITATDLTDLEYALLFIHKPPAGYGIDAWNGLYFNLSLADDGSISGPVNDVDLNILATPPDKTNLRPIEKSSLTPVAADAHRFGRVEIK